MPLRHASGEGPARAGNGPIALGVIWALRAIGYDGELIAQVRRDHERLGAWLGASSVISPGDEARDAMVATGANAYMPIVGDEVLPEGFPLIFDCVGSSDSQASTSICHRSGPNRSYVLLKSQSST